MLGKLSSFGLSPSKMAALDALHVNVMIADAHFTITYMNKGVTALLREAEADLRKELPSFRADSLIGRNIDVFDKSLSEQRNMLAKLDRPHSVTIRIGERAFDLRMVPLTRGGFVVEWADAKERLLNVDYTAQIEAIGRSQAMIAFTPAGYIIEANDNFLRVLGYTMEEIRGQHHSLFIEAAFKNSAAYADFWAALGRGEFQAAEYKRIGKNGQSVWIQGSYNPIVDQNGKVVKIVKFATDVTRRVQAVEVVGAALRLLADGNLETRIEQPLTPELDKLRVDFNGVLETLQGTMQRISEGTSTIRTGSNEIRLSSDDLSKRTERQAASLGETATALDEITATVKKTAAGATHAREVVSSAMGDAERSGEVVGQAVGAMTAIETSAQQVSQIIGVIDEIAFQTNLLALNAGVEAARAGDAGRGFAVVASEVRALAQRSAEAAKEIKALISLSSQQVSRGVSLVNQTGHSLQRIVAQVAELNTIMSDIAVSAKDQATNLDQVNTAVSQMDQTTQQNAAMVEQATAASHSLAREAEELAHLIAQFQTGEPAVPREEVRRAPAPKPAGQRVTALKTLGTGGAARKPLPQTEPGWEEF